MIPLLDVNDRIKVKENGFEGTIIKVHTSIGPGYEETKYTVVWDHFPDKEGVYMADEIKDMWEKIGAIRDALDGWSTHLPEARDSAPFPPLKVDMGDGKVTVNCNGYHTWLKYEGFTESYEYCKYCTEKRK